MLEKALALAGRDLIWEDLAHGRFTADPSSLGDVVLARKDTPTSYHLAVVVDDAAQGITLVTRGEDLLPATHLHRVLQQLLGLPVPRLETSPPHHGRKRKDASPSATTPVRCAPCVRSGSELSTRLRRAVPRSIFSALAPPLSILPP